MITIGFGRAGYADLYTRNDWLTENIGVGGYERNLSLAANSIYAWSYSVIFGNVTYVFRTPEDVSKFVLFWGPGEYIQTLVDNF